MVVRPHLSFFIIQFALCVAQPFLWLTIPTHQSQRLYSPTPVAATMRQPSAARSRDNASPRRQDLGPVGRKVFNCIVDDTALLQGAKKSTRDGIRKWIAGGQIRLFVPLYSAFAGVLPL